MVTLAEMRKLLLRAHANAEASKNAEARRLARLAFERSALGDNQGAASAARRSLRGDHGKNAGAV